MEINEDELKLIEMDATGSRARTKRIARKGLPELQDNARIEKRKRDAAQYRAGVALLWDRERILQETGWSLQRLMTVERYVNDEDKHLASDLDPRILWSKYRLRQLQAASELEDLIEIFKTSRQYNALVSAVKARSEVLDKIIKTGQELGVISRAAREVNLRSQIDVRSMSVSELRVHLRQEVEELSRLVSPPTEFAGPAGAILKRFDPPPDEKPPAPEGRRVKRLKQP